MASNASVLTDSERQLIKETFEKYDATDSGEIDQDTAQSVIAEALMFFDPPVVANVDLDDSVGVFNLAAITDLVGKTVKGLRGFKLPPCNLVDSRTKPGEVHPRFVDDPPTTRTDFDVPIGGHPSKVDLRDTGRLPPVYTQGSLGSCTANALAAAVHFDKPSVAPSRLFIYYNERVIEGKVADDTGADLADGIASLHDKGVCDESIYPYTEDKTRFAIAPPPEAYAAAVANEATKFENILCDHDHFKAALSSGIPIVLGLKVYEAIQSPEVIKTGRLPLPDPEKDTCLGGHAICVVGFDEEQQHWIVRNSWGEDWGDKGYFYIPYPYVSDTFNTSHPWIVKAMS